MTSPVLHRVAADDLLPFDHARHQADQIMLAFGRRPAISAVSPPTRATDDSLHAFTIPCTMRATVSASCLSFAM
jgi:hypothetical protein